jgi:hypothetical protein
VHLTPFNPQYRQQLASLQRALTPLSGGPTAHNQAYAVMYNILKQQAALLSYVDMFRFLVIVCLVCILAVLLFKKANLIHNAANKHAKFQALHDLCVCSPEKGRFGGPTEDEPDPEKPYPVRRRTRSPSGTRLSSTWRRCGLIRLISLR